MKLTFKERLGTFIIGAIFTIVFLLFFWAIPLIAYCMTDFSQKYSDVLIDLIRDITWNFKAISYELVMGKTYDEYPS